MTGVMAAYIAWQERSAGLSWGWTMGFAVVAILGGLFAFMNPQATLAWLLGVLAGFAIISGVLLLVGAAKMVSVQQGVNSTFNSTARA
jgi:uncharacterized membrane protein HdeD (DUF308 family)